MHRCTKRGGAHMGAAALGISSMYVDSQLEGVLSLFEGKPRHGEVCLGLVECQVDEDDGVFLKGADQVY